MKSLKLTVVHRFSAVALLFCGATGSIVAAPVSLENGKEIYQENCAPCHGASGGGDGPAAAVLKPKPRNFREGKFQYGDSAAQLKKTIKTGVKGTGMPAWGPTLKDREIDAVIEYVKSLKSL